MTGQRSKHTTVSDQKTIPCEIIHVVQLGSDIACDIIGAGSREGCYCCYYQNV